MSPRTGRPKSDNSKDTMFRVRIDEETVNKLEFASKELNIQRPEIERYRPEKVVSTLSLTRDTPLYEIYYHMRVSLATKKL